ncbi:Sarcosine dehydrogenase, partial [hydrothermal vent metagenome]
FESDLTVVREADDSFYIITATAQQLKDFDWISRHIPESSDAKLQDISEEFAVLSVMGPQSREKLTPLCDVDLSNESFPFGTSQIVEIAGVSVRAIRISYVGELGWELHVKSDNAVALWDALMPIRPIGNHAISAMRIEKGYRALGHELSAGESPLEAGLGFAICWDKEFTGKSALHAQKEAGVIRRLVSFVLDDSAVILWGGEPILRGGEIAGYTSSACYSPTLGRSVAMGYIKQATPFKASDLEAGDFEIVQLGKRYRATPSFAAPYDPKRSKILC